MTNKVIQVVGVAGSTEIPALDSSVQKLITAIKSTTLGGGGSGIGISGTIWLDNTTAPARHYVRRETIEGDGTLTISWENPDGTVATPTVSNLIAANAAETVVNNSVMYTASTQSSAYSVGDVILHMVGVDVATTPPSIAYSIWFNAGPSNKGNTTLTSAPNQSDLTRADTNTTISSIPLPANAATESGNLAIVAAAQGVSATGVNQPTGGSGVLGWLSGIYKVLTGGVAVTGNFYQATQPVSATSLPLPTGAATESGNLANVATSNSAISTATGTTGDSAYAGTGNSSIVSALKGIYAKIAGVLNIRALSSGTDSVTIVPVSTLPVSLTTVPLASNAATESGNLATVASNTGATSTALGVQADTAYTGTGGSSVVAALKGIYAKLAATQAVSVASLPLPSGAATETGNLSTIAAQATTLNASTGAQTDAAYTTGNGSVISLLKGLFGLLKSPLQVTGTFYQTTQPVSIASVPLASNAAQETGGNLDAVAASNSAISGSVGTTADSSYSGTGNASLVSILKGLFVSLNGTLKTRFLSSDNDSVTTVPSGTQQISATSLPLPTGAASENGNLADVASNTASLVTAVGASATGSAQPAGGSGILGWLSGIYTALTSGITVTGAFYQATQPVSAVTLPLPTGAAQETGGNLDSIAASNSAMVIAGGSIADAPYAGTGSASTVSLLKGLYAELAGTSASGTVVMMQDLDTNVVTSLSSTTRQLDGTEEALVVAISPNNPITIDQTQATVIGGVTPSGAIMRARAGLDGGMTISDAPPATVFYGALVNQMFIVDTSGFNSIDLEISGTWAGTITFYSSNDLQTWASTLGANSTGGAQTTTTVNGQFSFPVFGRYFKVTITTYTSGNPIATAYLRSKTSALTTNNLATLAGSAIVTAGVTGTLAVGGNVATGVAATINPLQAGGVDLSGLTRRFTFDSTGNAFVSGILARGYQYGTYNATYGGYTQTLSSLTAAQSSPNPVLTGGVDEANAVRLLLTNRFGALETAGERTTQAVNSNNELLTAILAMLKTIAFYDYNTYVQNGGPSSDEPDALFQENMNFLSSPISSL